MDQAQLPVISLSESQPDLAEALGKSFRHYGFALIDQHGINPDLIAQAWQMTREFFALPEVDKQRYAIDGLSGARGYTPFGVERAKGATTHDLKEFWHVGRDLPPGHSLSSSTPPNIWPIHPTGFRETFSELFADLNRVGAIILSAIAVNLGLSSDWFRLSTLEGNSVLRLLHYPPVTGATGEAIRAEAHEDINLITLLLGAEEAGLELLSKDGKWLSIRPPEGALVVNIGDMLQRLTNHVLPSTTHRVRNPDSARAAFSRYSMPFFLHLHSDFRFSTLPQCISSENPDRYPVPITADDFLQERLKEIGLKA
jgi:isopenicillin N synthase-like dioxygenase